MVARNALMGNILKLAGNENDSVWDHCPRARVRHTIIPGEEDEFLPHCPCLNDQEK